MLDLLLLEALLTNQGMSADALWALDGPMIPSLFSHSQAKDGYSVRKALRDLETLQSTLRRLTRLIDDGMSHVRMQCQSTLMSSGICGLPDDVLYFLFSYTCSTSSRKPRTLPPEVILSHVCKQFRTKILASPSLWSEIRSWYSQGMLSTYYERSRDVGLKVKLCLSHIDYPYSWFFGVSSAHVRRWKELYLSSDAELWVDKDGGVLQKLAIWLSNHSLDRLRLLSINFPPSSHDPYTNEKHSQRLQCYEEWAMPALRTLELSNILPGPQNSYQTVTSLRLTIDSCMLLNHTNKSDNWSFLQSSPSLENLTLSILSNFPKDSSIRLGPVKLPKLRALTLENCYGMSVKAFQNTLTHVHAPDLKELTINTEFSFLRPPNDYAKWVEHVLPLLANFPSVTDFALFFKPAYAHKDKRFPAEGLSHIFKALPKLKRLHFGCNSPFRMEVLNLEEFGGSSASIERAFAYPPLTRLCWVNCDVSDAYLSMLLRQLVIGPEWNKFEALEIVEDGKLYDLPKAGVGKLLNSKDKRPWTDTMKSGLPEAAPSRGQSTSAVQPAHNISGGS